MFYFQLNKSRVLMMDLIPLKINSKVKQYFSEKKAKMIPKIGNRAPIAWT